KRFGGVGGSIIMALAAEEAAGRLHDEEGRAVVRRPSGRPDDAGVDQGAEGEDGAVAGGVGGAGAEGGAGGGRGEAGVAEAGARGGGEGGVVDRGAGASGGGGGCVRRGSGVVS